MDKEPTSTTSATGNGGIKELSIKILVGTYRPPNKTAGKPYVPTKGKLRSLETVFLYTTEKERKSSTIQNGMQHDFVAAIGLSRFFLSG
jgi:hypothetical protein